MFTTISQNDPNTNTDVSYSSHEEKLIFISYCTYLMAYSSSVAVFKLRIFLSPPKLTVLGHYNLTFGSLPFAFV